MNIVFVLDKNYSSYLEVALKSVHYHHHNVNIYIIHDGISRAELTRVGQHLAHRGNSLHDFYIEDVNKLIVFPTVGSPDHIGAFSLVRLFVHRLLPKKSRKKLFI
ncbi:putative transferase-like protein [Haemophilus haemolyticus M21639]|nr:putative transferase-like protein [Haemophilus haemolyticus M21639]